MKARSAGCAAISLVRLVQQGVGILAASEWLTRSSIKAGALVQALPEWRLDTQSGIYFVRPSIEFPPAKIRLFKDWVERSFAGGVSWQ
jgi:DNA-binding transcriptional LysR family regulator